MPMPVGKNESISCSCGSCSITVANGRPVQHFLCGCEDCRQALQWCHIHGGIKPDPIPDLYYIPADITDHRGKEHMEAFKLRENGRSTRLVCKICHSLIAVDHPFYKSKVFLFFPKHCVTQIDLSLPPKAYIMMNDYSEDIGPLPTKDIPLFSSFKFKQERDRFSRIKGFNFIKETRIKFEGESFTSFLDENFSVKVLNLPKGKSLLKS